MKVVRVTALLVAAAGSACGARPVSPEPARFVGGKACEGCHQAAATAWRGSHHDRAMDVANESTVLGDFGGVTFTHFGVMSTFTRKNGEFFVRTDGPDGQLHEYAIAYTFGVDPLQQYLIRFPNGRLQALNVCWDTRPKEQGGQRWFHLYPQEAVPHDDVLHWTGLYQNWNFMCAECHSTNVKKGYDAAKDAFETTWSEIDVSCEACHGPGSNHVAWAHARRAGASTANTPDLGLTVRLGEQEPATWVMDQETGIALRDRVRTTRTEIEACGRCHARRGLVTEDYVPGRPLMDTHRVALLEPGLYQADGQILEEDYEYGSFLQSKMYAAGVTCTDCHDPHALKPLPGNGACLKCHLAQRFEVPAHHHHEQDGPAASCKACHMPATNYMVVHARHDHGFKVPRPDLTAKIGTPNACVRCHADKPLAWSISAYAKWWGTKRTDRPHWSETIAAGRANPIAAADALSALIDEEGTPAIVRATAVTLAEGAMPRTLQTVAGALVDSDPLVRDAAVRALWETDPRLRAKLLPPLTEDAVRTVRIDAGRALAGGAAKLLDPQQARHAADALEEWRASQRQDADRPEARLNLCVLEAELGDMPQAEVDCSAAARLAPRIPTVYVDLADVQRAEGREDEARATLRAGLQIAPDNAALWHAMGLALVRQHRPAEALAALKKATELEPRNPRFAEVYRIARGELRGVPSVPKN